MNPQSTVTTFDDALMCRLSILFKGVTYQTLTDPEFRQLVKEKIPTLELMQEYDATCAAKPQA